MTTLAHEAFASEINAAHQQAIHHAARAIEFAKHAGDLLLKVKADLRHGDFLPWLNQHCTVSARQAQRYIAAAQGKPIPIRAIKHDTVSHLEVNEGEAIQIRHSVGNWTDEVFICPRSDAPGYFHYAFVSGEDGMSANCTYTKRGISPAGIALILKRDIPQWQSASIERFPNPGYAINPFAPEFSGVQHG